MSFSQYTQPLTKENCISYREYNVEGKPDEKVILLFDKPLECIKDGVTYYSSRYRILGNGIDDSFYIYGEDGVQVMLDIVPLAEQAIIRNDLHLLFGDEKDLFLNPMKFTTAPTYLEVHAQSQKNLENIDNNEK